MWPYLFSSRCGRILLGSYHMPDSVIGTACVLWPDSAVEHVGGLGRYSDRKSCVRIGAFNLIYTTCIRYISCICIYLGNFVFVLGCFFVYLFYCWIFFPMFLSLPSDYPSFAVRKRYHVKLSLIHVTPALPSSPFLPFNRRPFVYLHATFSLQNRLFKFENQKSHVSLKILNNCLSVSNKDPNYYVFP